MIKEQKTRPCFCPTIDSCWRDELSNFSSEKFEKVEPFLAPKLGPNETEVDVDTKNSISNSGSNETIPSDLASIVFFLESKKDL